MTRAVSTRENSSGTVSGANVSGNPWRREPGRPFSRRGLDGGLQRLPPAQGGPAALLRPLDLCRGLVHRGLALRPVPVQLLIPEERRLDRLQLVASRRLIRRKVERQRCQGGLQRRRAARRPDAVRPR